MIEHVQSRIEHGWWMYRGFSVHRGEDSLGTVWGANLIGHDKVLFTRTTKKRCIEVIDALKALERVQS